jgi:hypothetical protein
MYDYYSVWAGTFPKSGLNLWTEFTKSVMKQGKKDGNMVIPILQMFNYKAFAKKGQKAYKGNPVNKLRYPNTQELRYMCFASITLGARGLAFFSFWRSREVDWYWGKLTLAPVLHDVKTFENQIAGFRLQQISQAKNNHLFLTTWSNKKKIFLMLINASPKSRDIQQPLTGTLKKGTITPWGHTRKVSASLKNGSIVVKQMKPWEVLIWQVQ